MMKSYEFQADMIFAQLVGGRVDLFHHLSTMDGDEVLEAALEKWVDGKEDVAFSHHFTLSSVLEASIESHELYGQRGSVIEEGAKPLFDAMRAELVAMLERIDSLAYCRASGSGNAAETDAETVSGS